MTGTVSATVSLRSVLSLLPVHRSNRGFLTAPAISFRTAADSPLEAAPMPETPSVEAFCRNVLKSVRNAATLMLAVMWVVSVPPTLSVPTTFGSCSQSSGLMPSLASVPEPPLLPVVPTCERLDSSFWNVACRQLIAGALERDVADLPVERMPSEPLFPSALTLTVKFDCGSLPLPEF